MAFRLGPQLGDTMPTDYATMERKFLTLLDLAYNAAGQPFGPEQADAIRWSTETDDGRSAKGEAMDESGITNYMIGLALPIIISVMEGKK